MFKSPFYLVILVVMQIEKREIYIIGEKFVPHSKDGQVDVYQGFQQTSRRITEKDGKYLLDFQCVAFYRQGGSQSKAGIIIGEGYSLLSNTDIGSKELAFEATDLLTDIETTIYEHYKGLAGKYNYAPSLFYYANKHTNYLHLSLKLWKWDNINLYQLHPEDFK